MSSNGELSGLAERAALQRFARYAAARFKEDNCLRVASSLSYTSLLAIVPLTAIAFSMLAAFPVFEGAREQFQVAMFENLLPSTAAATQEYFNTFVRNSTMLSAVGIVGLALTAILLLGTIESAMNGIFRVARPRALGPRLLVFWALITLGPLMLGASFSLSGYLFAATKWLGVDDSGFGFLDLASVLPTLMIIFAFFVFYLIVPNRPVDARGAILGAVIAGLLFSGLRKIFGIYVASFPTYQTVYGAVSAVPIFLVWMYTSWTVILLGAYVTAAFGEWRSAGGNPGGSVNRPAERLRAALAILSMLYTASLNGRVVPRTKLLRETGFGEAAIDRLLVDLRKANMIENSRRGWMLCRDISTVTLFELYEALGLTVRDSDATVDADGWHGIVGERLAALGKAQKRELDITLRALFATLFDIEIASLVEQSEPISPSVNPLTGSEKQDENEPTASNVTAVKH